MSNLPLTKHPRECAFVTLLAAAVVWPGCGSESPAGTTGGSGTPGSVNGSGTLGGTGAAGAVTGAGAASTGSGTANGGASNIGSTGTGVGGAQATNATAAGTGVGGLGVGGGMIEPPMPEWEQDDPNLHPDDSAYERVPFPAEATNVMSFDVDKNERVYVLERAGRLRIWDSENNVVINAGTLPVFSGNEDGALAFVLDPNFSTGYEEGTNRWAYIYYSSDSASENVLSRFSLDNDVLALDSESVLLTVPDEREVQWHVGGGLDFDSQGNLYLSTGENTNPFESDGFSPHDERAGRALYDSQRTAANSNELRGKILRIKPTDDGGYDIPEGNLFDAANGRPEVYIMGNRNPFRIAIDRANDWLYWGEVGPDAGDGDEDLQGRGPRGYDEFNQAKQPGFYGWPYCIADNIPYVYHDFGGGASRGPFNCDAPVNDSPNNTGVRELPPAQPAWLAYSYGTSPYPALNGSGGRTGLMGAVYRWQPGGSINKLPRYYDGSVLLMDFTRGWLAEARTDAEGNLQSVEPFLESLGWSQPIQMRISPNGVLYVGLYGASATVHRVNYVGNNNRPPVAVASSDVDSGPTPLTVQFSSQGSSDVEGDALSYSWDLDGDTVYDSTDPNPSFVYNYPGNYPVSLLVSDGNNQSLATLQIVAGNTRPVVTLDAPPSGGFVGEGEQVLYSVSVTDAEEGSTASGISCDLVTILPGLGHDLHVDEGMPSTGCSGSITTATGIMATQNYWPVLRASYTDQAHPVIQLTAEATARLHFKRKQAEHFQFTGEASEGLEILETNDPEGGAQHVAYIDDGSYICWNEMNFQNITAINYRVASGGVGGRIEVRQDSPSGTELGLATVEPTGGWQSWTTVSGTLTDPGGTHKVCFVFRNNPNDELLFNLNWLEFSGQGISQ